MTTKYSEERRKPISVVWRNQKLGCSRSSFTQSRSDSGSGLNNLGENYLEKHRSIDNKFDGLQDL